MFEQFISHTGHEEGKEKFPWHTIVELINKKVVTLESAIKDVKGKDGEALESHALKFEFPKELEGLGTSMADEIWHYGDYYVALQTQNDKFVVAVAQVVSKV